MKTALEMRGIANEFVERERTARRELATNYTEEVIAPLMEKVAEKGGHNTFIAKDKGIDFGYVKCYLEQNGYEVRLNKHDIEVAW